MAQIITTTKEQRDCLHHYEKIPVIRNENGSEILVVITKCIKCGKNIDQD